MAKSRSFFGLRKGSTKSLTFSIRNGKQVTKDRVSEVTNPNTPGQLYQRAIMATIMQAYSKGKAIFDHSFEGKKHGADSQNYFMKINLNRLRNLVGQDIANYDNHSYTQQAFIVARGSNYPNLDPLIVSEGSLVQSLFAVTTDGDDKVKATPAAPSATTIKLAKYCEDNNLQAGDIFTLVAFGLYVDLDSNMQSPCRFNFIRLTVKASALTDETTTMATATLADLFEQDAAGTSIPGSTLLTGAINVDQVCPSCLAGCMGVIFSREDSKMRSNTTLVMPAKDGFGIWSRDTLSVWGAQANTLGGSPWILEGGNF